MESSFQDRVQGVPGLIDALADRDLDTRLAAIGALAEIGPQAKAALPALNGIWDYVGNMIEAHNVARNFSGPPTDPDAVEAELDELSRLHSAVSEAIRKIEGREPG